MPGWNIADVLDIAAQEVPDNDAVISGDRRISWRLLMERASSLARHLTATGLPRQATVVQYMRNRPEYIESFIGALVGSFAPVNTNFRYGPKELAYLWSDCQAGAVVFAGEFTPTIEKMRDEVPRVASWLWVDDGHGTCPDWATPYEFAATGSEAPDVDLWPRDGDDLVLIYTGGTTGLPKGVMWRQDDLFVQLLNAANGRYPDVPDTELARSRVSRHGRRHLPAAPLMHGAGCLTCIPFLARGGAIVLLEEASFRPAELLDAVEREGVYSVGWVGDAFARPVLDALNAEPARWALDSWKVITSGGVLFSDSVKRGLLKHLPGLTIADVYGSTEAITAARSVTQAGSHGSQKSFEVGKNVVVLDDHDQPVVPGSRVIGRFAYTGRMPVGYFRDDAKTAATFQMIGGVRHSFTGDYAVVESDGRISILGRGSGCINTGGEKVYPEEVEEVLKRDEAVADVAVLGVPDERFGERIVAAVQVAPGHILQAGRLTDLVRAELAPYKTPRQYVAVPMIARGPSGKIDVDALRPVVLKEMADLAL